MENKLKFFTKHTNDKIIFYICLIFLISLTLSFTWPFENVKITSTFGESRGDHFHNGIDMISGGAKVYPVDEGELVFFWDNSIFPTENYPGGGNYKILAHKNGYYSVYMHLTDSPSYKNLYSKNDPVGGMGTTGHSSGRHLHLSMVQINSKKLINPLIIFPKIPDIVKPTIEEAYVRIEDKYFRIKDKDNIRLTQHYPLLINIWDSMNKGDRLGIYKLLITLNGEKIADNDYSEISMTNNVLKISGKAFEELFDEKGYYKASRVKYIDGINNLSVTATDYSGNESSKELSFTVKLDMQ
jgi:hypothetical protein